MDSFEDLGLSPDLVEALAAEGIEVPTTLQRESIPVLRKGNSALVRGGPGAGVLVAYGSALLDRLEAARGAPGAVVLVPLPGTAEELARSLGRPAMASGHRVAALGAPFALPERADVLFATPQDLLDAVGRSEIELSGVEAFVLDGAAALLDESTTRDAVQAIRDGLPEDGVQVVVIADPVTDEVRGFVNAHARRAVFLPPELGGAEAAAPDGEPPVRRGSLRVRTVEQDESTEVARIVGELVDDGARHVLLHFRSEDRAVDVGDVLGLHGFASGAPGEPDVPVWLGTDSREARAVLDAEGGPEGVVVVSVDVPSDEDELDRRHGGARAGGVVLARPRELPHLRRLARDAGYTAAPFPRPRNATRAGEVAFARRVESALAEDLTPYLLLLEPHFRTHGSAEVAAALALLLRRRDAASEVGAGPAFPADAQPAAGRPAAFVRLFLSIGSRDGIGPGDLLGAITGETGIPGERVGRIDVRDTFSRVEVEEEVAAAVIGALNGKTVRGRSVRADYDRKPGKEAEGGASGRRPTGGKRPSGGKPRGGRPPGGGRPSGGRPPGRRPSG